MKGAHLYDRLFRAYSRADDVAHAGWARLDGFVAQRPHLAAVAPLAVLMLVAQMGRHNVPDVIGGPLAIAAIVPVFGFVWLAPSHTAFSPGAHAAGYFGIGALLMFGTATGLDAAGVSTSAFAETVAGELTVDLIVFSWVLGFIAGCRGLADVVDPRDPDNPLEEVID